MLRVVARPVGEPGAKLRSDDERLESAAAGARHELLGDEAVREALVRDHQDAVDAVRWRL